MQLHRSPDTSLKLNCAFRHTSTIHYNTHHTPGKGQLAGIEIIGSTIAKLLGNCTCCVADTLHLHELAAMRAGLTQ